MNKELIEILKCISEITIENKCVFCDGFYDVYPEECSEVQCSNCLLNTPPYTIYKPYLIKL